MPFIANEDSPVVLAGDAYLTFTAPFYAKGDPLTPRTDCVPPTGEHLDGSGDLLHRPLSWSTLMQGSLTFEHPVVEPLTTFAGSDDWCDELAGCLSGHLGQGRLKSVAVLGAIFPDGYGSIAVTLHLPDAWAPRHQARTLATVGPEGREPLAADLRERLLPPVERLLRRCGAGESVVLPYFNLTYVGGTDHPVPGRAALSDRLRTLLYPESPLPLHSHSPWRDEFLYAGYAYNLLAMKEPRPSAEKFTLLLLILDVAYIRLARTAAAADEVLRTRERKADTAWLAQLADRLRAEYQSLVTPTFSFDHHCLKVRDAVLSAWEAGKLQSRTEDLLTRVQQAVDLELAETQERRIRKVNLLVAALTALSTVATVEAAVSLFDHFFG